MARKKSTASKEMRKLLRNRRLANRGDLLAARRLRSTVESWAKRANKMLDRLEAHGFTRQAYESAQNFIKPAFGEDATRFATDLTNSRALYKEAMALNHFFTLESSTISGAMAIQKRRIAAFRAKFKGSEALKKMRNKDILDFFDFLHDNPVGEFLKDNSRYQSGDEMDTYMEAIYVHGISTDAVSKALAAYQRTRNWEIEHPDQEMPEDEKFYLDDLVKYLKGGHKITWNGWKYSITHPNV